MKKILKKNNKNQEDVSMKEKIKKILIQNAAGLSFKAKEDDYLDLVVWCALMEEKFPTKLSGTEGELYHLKAQLYAIAPELSANLLLHPEQIHLLDYYIYLINHWDEWKGCSVTYRLLADLVELAAWEC